MELGCVWLPQHPRAELCAGQGAGIWHGEHFPFNSGETAWCAALVVTHTLGLMAARLTRPKTRTKLSLKPASRAEQRGKMVRTGEGKSGRAKYPGREQPCREQAQHGAGAVPASCCWGCSPVPRRARPGSTRPGSTRPGCTRPGCTRAGSRAGCAQHLLCSWARVGAADPGGAAASCRAAPRHGSGCVSVPCVLPARVVGDKMSWPVTAREGGLCKIRRKWFSA